MMISQFNDHTRKIVISGVIKEDTAAIFLEQLVSYEHLDVTKPITIYIDTYGGSVDAAMSIYDAIATCGCPIRTVGIGKVMSAGVLILAAGDKGHRYITQNARVMMHQVSGGVAGTIKDIDIAAQEISRLQDVFVNLLAKHTGKKTTEIMEDIGRDKYLTSYDAVKYGLVDHMVLPKKKNIKVVKKKVVKGKKK